MYMYICQYNLNIHICLSVSFSLENASEAMATQQIAIRHICIYMYTCICIYVCVYVGENRKVIYFRVNGTDQTKACKWGRKPASKKLLGQNT